MDAKFTDVKGGVSKPSSPVRSHTPNPIPSSPALLKPTNFPVKKLTPEEIQKNRERGQCCFYDDKWTRGHRCIHKQLLMLDLVSVDEGEAGPPLADTLPEIHHLKLSECAFYGTNAKYTMQTMKVEGSVNGQLVTILLDSDSTHNFIDSRLFKKLGWATAPTRPFEVMIADGGRVSSSGCCTNTALNIGGYTCAVDLFALPLGGCDVVLGIHWLSSISLVLWDFQLMTLQFSKEGCQ